MACPSIASMWLRILLSILFLVELWLHQSLLPLYSQRHSEARVASESVVLASILAPLDDFTHQKMFSHAHSGTHRHAWRYHASGGPQPGFEPRPQFASFLSSNHAQVLPMIRYRIDLGPDFSRIHNIDENNRNKLDLETPRSTKPAHLCTTCHP